MESGLLANHRSVTVRVGRVRCEAEIAGGVWATSQKNHRSVTVRVGRVRCEAEIAGGVWATSQIQVSYSQGGQGSL